MTTAYSNPRRLSSRSAGPIIGCPPLPRGHPSDYRSKYPHRTGSVHPRPAPPPLGGTAHRQRCIGSEPDRGGEQRTCALCRGFPLRSAGPASAPLDRGTGAEAREGTVGEHARPYVVEVEPSGLIWVKSSVSSGSNASCVELASAGKSVIVRDSADRSGSRLSFTQRSWRTFLTGF
ncbi:MAG: DUF397 domain-containing protein [Kibdelosporangium sp.]